MNPSALLGELINGYWKSMIVAAAARLDLADRLAAGPKTVAQLAHELDADEGALYRLLRALASLGIFAESEGRTFAQTPLSEPLRANVRGSMRGLATMTAMLHFHAWPELIHSVKSGRTGFSKVFGVEVFEHLQRDPEAARAFDEAMAGYTAVTASAIVAAYDFSPFATLADLGGGAGALLAAITEKFPLLRGINFDLAHVIGRAQPRERVELVAGDFFQSVPKADAYTLKLILHDWDDEKSLTILRNVRKACSKTGKLLVIDAVIPPGNEPSFGKLMDINMLVMTGGRERTEAEFAALYRAAGFELTRVIAAPPAPISIVEGKPS
jgi:hypothetical protein